MGEEGEHKSKTSSASAKDTVNTLWGVQGDGKREIINVKKI